MKFLWPDLLWLAALMPVVMAGLGVLLLRRRAMFGARARALVTMHRAARPAARWMLVAPALLVVALLLLGVAAARPTAWVMLLSQQRTVILAMDVSGSMQALDVAPNPICASQAAAKAFASRLPRNVRVGVVAYADSAQLVLPPTTRREDVLAAIDRLQVQQGTAIGSGILVSLGAIFPGEALETADSSARARKIAAWTPAPRPWTDPVATPVAPGSYASAAIVLLTDGQSTVGPEPMEAAQMAASRGVRVYTVGFGTKDGKDLDVDDYSMLVRLDEDTLRKVADVTRAEYFQAGSGADLDRVYQGLQSKLVVQRQDTEITSFFAAAATLLLTIAVGLSVWRNASVV